MEEKEIKVRLMLTEQKIEMIEDFIKFNKKYNKTLLVLGVITLVMVMFITGKQDKLNPMDVFSISLGTCAIYKLLNDMIVEKNKNSHELSVLNLEKEYYNDLLQSKKVKKIY